MKNFSLNDFLDLQIPISTEARLVGIKNMIYPKIEKYNNLVKDHDDLTLQSKSNELKIGILRSRFKKEAEKIIPVEKIIDPDMYEDKKKLEKKIGKNHLQNYESVDCFKEINLKLSCNNIICKFCFNSYLKKISGNKINCDNLEQLEGNGIKFA